MKTFRKCNVANNFQIKSQLEQRKETFKQIKDIVPLAKAFNYKNFMYELKPIFAIMLQEKIRYNEIASQKTSEPVVRNSESNNNIIANKMKNTNIDENVPDAHDSDGLEDESTEESMANKTYQSIMSYASKIKAKQEEEAMMDTEILLLEIESAEEDD
jgi:hypothetical protein